MMIDYSTTVGSRHTSTVLQIESLNGSRGARGPLIVEFSGAHKNSKNNFLDKIDSIFVIYTKNWVC